MDQAIKYKTKFNEVEQIIENTKQRCSECEFEDCRLVKIKGDNNLV